MHTDRDLLIVNSVYQLLTAVNLRHTLLRGRTADLILTDVLPHQQDYAGRVRETGAFDRVILARTAELNRKYTVGKPEEISEGYDQIDRIFRWVLAEELADYEKVYFANFDTFTRMLACRLGPACEFVWYEDGFSSYVIHYLREDRAAVNRHPKGSAIADRVRTALLYQPRLAMRGDAICNRALPKIDQSDTQLRERLNYIFDYRPPQEGAPFIFLEQSFRADRLRTNDIDLMRECRQAVGPSQFIVKPHPRNPENVPLRLGLTRRYTDRSPWELLLLNGDVRGKTVLTVCSNAALTGRLVFGLDLPTVMLYELFEGKVLWQEDAVLRRYLRAFQRQFAGENYYVPKTVYELRSILHYLGGHHANGD